MTVRGTAVSVILFATLSGALFALGCGESRHAQEEVLVSAASSLTEVFNALEETFERQYPAWGVEANLGGSTALREQILNGAPVSIYIPADPTHLEPLRASGWVGEEHELATAAVTIGVPRGNPGGVKGATDLGREELWIGLCARGVPCGDLARVALGRAGVEPHVDTEESSVRSLLSKLEVGELDAGVVYETDVLAAADHVESIALEPDPPTAQYTLAVSRRDLDNPTVRAFVALVLSAEGKEVLLRHGFGTP